MSMRVGAPLGRCPAMFHPSVMCGGGKGIKHLCVAGPYVEVPVAPVCTCVLPWGIHVCVCRCDGGQEASLTRPCTGGSRPGPSFPLSGSGSSNCPPLDPPQLVPEPAFVSFTGGQRGGGRHCGNSDGILGIQPFRGVGGSWKTPTRPKLKAQGGHV